MGDSFLYIIFFFRKTRDSLQFTVYFITSSTILKMSGDPSIASVIINMYGSFI